MSRRVSLAGVIIVAAIWCGVLLTPSLRVLLRAQSSPELEKLTAKLGLREKPLARVLREHPHDPRVLAQQVEYGALRTSQERKAALARYDRLIERFPRELWLIQKRLRTTMNGKFPIDIGEFASRNSRSEESWLSRAELLQSLKIAERGARLDPQNSFYDWMRAIFLFALRRDEDALRALQQGARKTRYDDGVLREIQNRDAVLAMQGAPVWEERITASALILLPHYAPMRNVNRAAIWRGVLAAHRGDHARALEIYGAQMDLCRMMWRDSPVLIGTLLARQMEEQAWSAPFHKNGETTKTARNESNTERLLRAASRFAEYTRRHNRADLAEAALRDARLFASINVVDWPKEMVSGVSYDLIRPMLRLQWTNALLLRAVQLSTLAWLMMSIILWGTARSHDSVRASLLDVISSTVFIAIACFILLVSALHSTQEPFEFVWSHDLEFWGQSSDSYLQAASVWFIWLPLILAGIYCVIVMLWRGRKSTPLAEESDASIERAKRPLGLMAWAAATIGFSWLWWKWLPKQNLNDFLTFIGSALPFLAGWTFYQAGKHWLARHTAREIIYGFAWMRSTLGALIVAGSVAYFVCSLFALPLRRQANARLDDYIARGEVALLRETEAPR